MAAEEPRVLVMEWGQVAYEAARNASCECGESPCDEALSWEQLSDDARDAFRAAAVAAGVLERR